MSEQRSRRRDRSRLGRAGDRCLLRRARPPGDRPRHPRREGGGALARRGHDPRARPGRDAAAQRRADHLHDRHAGAARRARLLFVCVDTPPTYSGDADLSRVRAVVDELRGGLRPRAGDEEHRPRRDRRRRSAATCPGSPTSPARSSSRRGRRSTTSCIPTGSWSAPIPATRRPPTRSRRSTRRSAASDPAHRRRQRRDDQARLERLPGDQDLLHQRDRQRLRGGRRRRRARSPAGWGSTTRIGPSFLRAGIGYGGSCFPKDVCALKMLAGNTGYHFQLLNSVIEVNELQKRRVVGKLRSTSAR